MYKLTQNLKAVDRQVFKEEVETFASESPPVDELNKLQKLKKVQNASAGLILKSSRRLREHSKPSHKKAVHWLPVSERIKYKLSGV